MLLMDVYSFCKDTWEIWQFVGYILFIFKIVVPILLIIFGAMDLGKAVVANDDKEIKNATLKLAKRAIAAIVIFFLPTLFGFLFSIVAGFSEVKDVYEGCKTCVVSPNSKNCSESMPVPKRSAP